MKLICASILVLIAGYILHYGTSLSDDKIDAAKCFPDGVTLVTLGEPARPLWDQGIYSYHTDNRGRVQWETGGCGSISINGMEKYGRGSQPEDIVSNIRVRFYQDRLTIDEVGMTLSEFLPEGASIGPLEQYRGEEGETIWTAHCSNTSTPCSITIRETPGYEWGASDFILEIDMGD